VFVFMLAEGLMRFTSAFTANEWRECCHVRGSGR